MKRFGRLAGVLLCRLAASRRGRAALARRGGGPRARGQPRGAAAAWRTCNTLRGRANEARADALPELSVYGSFQRYRDPGLLNSTSFDQFPPELLAACVPPLPPNLYERPGGAQADALELQARKAIRAARFAEQLGDENVRSRAPGHRAASPSSPTTPTCSRSSSRRWRRRSVTQKRGRSSRWRRTGRRRGRDRPRRAALRGGPRERAHQLLRAARRVGPGPRGRLNAVHRAAHRHPDRAHRRPRVRGRDRRARRGGRAKRGRAGRRRRPSTSPRRSHESSIGIAQADLRPQPRPRRRLRLVGPPAPELLRDQVLEVERSASP